MHAAQVVQPARGEELPVRTEDRRGGGVVGDQVVAVDLLAVALGLLRDVGEDLQSGPADAPDRCGVLLLVQLQALVVDPAIEMDGELRDPHDRLGADQPDLARGQHQPASQPQLAVEPGVEQRRTVDLDADLLPAVPAEIRSRLELEPGRVGVRAHDPARRTRSRVLRHPPGDQRSVADQIVTAGTDREVLPLVLLDEPGRRQPPPTLGRRMPRRRRRRDERPQIGSMIERLRHVPNLIAFTDVVAGSAVSNVYVQICHCARETSEAQCGFRTYTFETAAPDTRLIPEWRPTDCQPGQAPSGAWRSSP